MRVWKKLLPEEYSRWIRLVECVSWNILRGIHPLHMIPLLRHYPGLRPNAIVVVSKLRRPIWLRWGRCDFRSAAGILSFWLFPFLFTAMRLRRNWSDFIILVKMEGTATMSRKGGCRSWWCLSSWGIAPSRLGAMPHTRSFGEDVVFKIFLNLLGDLLVTL